MTRDEKTATLNALRKILDDYDLRVRHRKEIIEELGEEITNKVDEGIDPFTGCAFRPSGNKSDAFSENIRIDETFKMKLESVKAVIITENHPLFEQIIKGK